VGTIVYHYTDTQAFAGIVQNAALWATDFRYLNDSLELVYTWQAFVERLEQLAARPGENSQAYKAALEALRLHKAIDLMGFDDAMFVACFSELEDVLSQWSRYGANGRGLALGFDSERISALKVPQYRHTPDGEVIPMTAILSGGPSSGSEVEFTWNAFLLKVSYGDTERDRVVDGLIDTVERVCADTPDSFSHMVGNCISQTHALVHRLPLVKNAAFDDERERRVTITEYFGGRSAAQRRALSSLGEPFSFYAQGALETVDVQFRPADSTMFKPYVCLPFDRAALVKVVTGPAIRHHLVEPTVRRLLDRNRFRHTAIEASTLPYQG
jgi:hypothetical protein